MKHWFTRVAYRLYRRLKLHFIRQPSMLGRMFFRSLGVAEKLMSARRVTAEEIATQKLWKATYTLRYGGETPFQVETEQQLAIDSDDHKWPHGTIHDNSVNLRFNLKLYDYFDHRSDLCVLDLGCAGGGFVKSVLEDGFVAIGLEGSDVSKKLRSGEWEQIPYHLFTCDITSPFRVLDRAGEPIGFHCITAWEVLEHIPEDKLSGLFKNVRQHLAPEGIFVASVDYSPDENPLTGAVYHVTLHDRAWWLERCAAHGFREVRDHPFETRDYVRGHGMGLKDWDPADGDGFHLVIG